MSITGHTEDPKSPGLDGYPRSSAVLPSALPEIDDHGLLALMRAGEDAAFAELFSRHARAVRGFALRYSSDVAEADDIAAEAFFRVLQAVRRGSGPEGNVRGYLLTVVRRLAAEWRVRHRDVPTADEELSRRVDPDIDHTAGRAEAHLIARAFTSLPQRWRTVLWQVDVQGERPAVVARHFGLTPNATAALARRAREGLRAAYLQAHVSPAASAGGCRTVVDRLGAYTAGNLRAAESRRIAAHLAGCQDCRSLHDELADVCAGLRRHAGLVVPPALAGHKLLAGKAAGAVGKAVAYGTRMKLAVAATSMVAVGGLGVAAGPMIGHMLPNLTVDRSEGLRLQVSPVAPDLTSGSTGTAASSGTLGPKSPPGPLGTRTMRGESRQITGPPAGTGSSSVTSSALPESQSSVTGTSGPPAGSPDAVGSTSGSMTIAEEPGGSPVTQTSDPSPTPTAQIDPTLQSGRSDPETTVWSTVWTTNGTTIWETVWSRLPRKH